MREPDLLAAQGKAREQPFEQAQHLLFITGKAAIHAQKFAVVFQHIGVAAAGRLDGGEHQAVGQPHGADLGVEGRAAVLDHELGEAADIVKRLKRWLVLLVEQLHELVGLYEHGVGLRLRKREDLAHLVGEGDVEHRAVEQAVGHLVVEDADLANAGDLVDEALDLAGVFDEQAHLEVLHAGAVLLRADVGDVDPVTAQHFQHRRHRAGTVGQGKHDHQYALAVLKLGQIAALGELAGDLRVLRGGGGHFDEQRVRVHGAVVVDAGDVAPAGGDDAAGEQERARLVRHPRDVCLSHGCFLYSGMEKAHLQLQVSSVTSG